jgi:hypothetical protein
MDVMFVAFRDQLRQLVPQEDEPYLDFQFPIRTGNVSSVVVYSHEYNYVFWVESDPAQLARVKRVTVDDMNRITDEKVLIPPGWAIEPRLIIGRNYLYWIDTGLKTIGVTHLDGTFPKFLVKDTLQSPRGLVLDKLTKQLYWFTVTSSGAELERANEGGEERAVLLSLGARSRPVAMTIKEDRFSSILFWIDQGLKQVTMATVSGPQPVEAKRLCSLDDGEEYTDIAYHVYSLGVMEEDCLVLTTRSGAVKRFCGRYTNLTTVHSGPAGPAHSISVTKTEPRGYVSAVIDCEDNNGGCDQYCFPDPHSNLGSSFCSCSDNYHPIGKLCITKPSFYIVGGRGKIRVLNASLSATHIPTTVSILSNGTLSPISTLYWDKLVLWVDNNGIYRVPVEYFLNRTTDIISVTGKPQLVVPLQLSNVGDIAVDWLEGNVYWTLPQEGRLDYASVKNGGHRVLVSGLDHPTKLTVDAENRTLYWVSGGPGKLVIFNCTLPTCTPQQVEELSPEANTTSLSLNVKKGALLWSEMSAHQSKVWYLNILHSNRAPKVNLKTFNRTETEVQSLAALDEHVYLLERVRGTQGYVQVVGQNGVTTNSRDLFSSEFMDIDILGPAAQPGVHPCTHGICSHICVAVNNGYECRCPIGSKLDGTGRECKDYMNSGEFVFVASKTSIFVGHYDPMEGRLSREDLQMLPFTGSNIQFIQYDPVRKELYVADKGTASISGINLSDWSQRDIASGVIYSIFNWTSLQYDYLGATLYWGLQHDIEAVSTIRRDTVGVVFRSNTAHYNNLAVHSHNSALYWIGETLDYGQTEQCEVDLSHSVISCSRLHLGDVRQPHSLVVDDVDTGDLYWVDTVLRSIRHFKSLSKETEELIGNLDFTTSRPVLRMARNHVYWYNDSSDSIHRAIKTNGENTQSVLEDFPGLRDFYVGKDYILGGGNPFCFRPDTPCTHWCAEASTNAGYICRCPLNHRLLSNGGCEALPCNSGETACYKGQICISNSYFCNGFMECPDGTDEYPVHSSCTCHNDMVECKKRDLSSQCIPRVERCQQSHLNSCLNTESWECADCSDKFRCSDLKCVDKVFVCDGFNDCEDEKDELGCNSTSTPVTSSGNTPLPNSGDGATIATAVCLSLATVVVLAFLLFLLAKYCRSRRGKSQRSQNGSAVRLTSSTAMSTTSTVHYGETSDVSSYVTNTDITKDTNVSMIADPDLLTKYGLRRLSDVSVETIVTTDPIGSDPPPSPVTVKSEAIVPSIVPSQGFDQETVYNLRAPAPSVNMSCYSDFDRVSSVSEQTKRNMRPITIANAKKRTIHFHIPADNTYLDYSHPPSEVMSGHPPSEVMSMASNSHCTPPPPPSPVTLRSTIDVIQEQDYSSSSTMV